jgi:hypothetical protein
VSKKVVPHGSARRTIHFHPEQILRFLKDAPKDELINYVRALLTMNSILDFSTTRRA